MYLTVDLDIRGVFKRGSYHTPIKVIGVSCLSVYEYFINSFQFHTDFFTDLFCDILQLDSGSSLPSMINV
jgi:hypothetical protein